MSHAELGSVAQTKLWRHMFKLSVLSAHPMLKHAGSVALRQPCGSRLFPNMLLLQNQCISTASCMKNVQPRPFDVQPSILLNACKRWSSVTSNTKRPLSPHLSIYEPQLTWLMSISHRVTGSGLAARKCMNLNWLSTVLYGGGIIQAFYPFSGSYLAAAVHTLPFALLIVGKFVASLSYMFHAYNGVRHLVSHAGSLANVSYGIMAIACRCRKCTLPDMRSTSHLCSLQYGCPASNWKVPINQKNQNLNVFYPPCTASSKLPCQKPSGGRSLMEWSWTYHASIHWPQKSH